MQAGAGEKEVDGVEERLDRLAEMMARVEVGLDNLRTMLAGLAAAQQEQERRLRALENWKHRLTPWLAVATFIAGALFQAGLGKVL